tara:strand:- start:3784 stop:4359 length:576 start_codon:yes stop_codon:yes gene_type:complete
MPVSDGAIRSRDLAENAVTNVKIGPLAVTAAEIDTDAVTTAKIAPLAVGTEEIAFLAVDTDEMLHPVHVDSSEANASDVSLDTTATNHVSFTFTIPSWVGTAHILAWSYTLIVNTYGGFQEARASTRIAGVDDGSGAQAIANGTTGNTMHMEDRIIVGPGSTVVCANFARVSVSTNSTNRLAVWGTILGLR